MLSITFNSNKTSPKKLKKQHDQYFQQLITQANGQLFERNKNGEKIEKAILFTNSEHLAKVLSCSPRTIRNYNTRLCEAGIIKKIYHGQTKNYEIIFNKYIVPVTDRNNLSGYWPIYEPAPDITSIARQIRKTYMRKNLPTIKELLDHYNNQLIGKVSINNQENPVELTKITKYENSGSFTVNCLKDYLRLLSGFGYSDAKTDGVKYEATGNKGRAKPLEMTPQQKKDIPPATVQIVYENIEESKTKKMLKKIRSSHMREILKNSDTEELKYVFAYLLMSYSIAKIPGWKNNLSENVTGNAVIYIAENYFNECKNRNDFDKQLDTYYKVINISARIIRKKVYSGQWTRYWVFPVTFFSVDYNKGFMKAFYLLKKNQAEREKRHIDIQRKAINRKLGIILSEYYSNPCTLNYTLQLEKVKKLLPTREKQFIYCIKNNIRNIIDYYYQNA